MILTRTMVDGYIDQLERKAQVLLTLEQVWVVCIGWIGDTGIELERHYVLGENEEEAQKAIEAEVVSVHGEKKGYTVKVTRLMGDLNQG